MTAAPGDTILSLVIWVPIAAGILVLALGDRNVRARVDGNGIYARQLSPNPVPWSQVTGAHVIRFGFQRLARFDIRDPAAGRTTTFGINTTYYDRGMAELIAAVRHHRPDLLR